VFRYVSDKRVAEGLTACRLGNPGLEMGLVRNRGSWQNDGTMAETLLDMVWRAHTVRTLPSGQIQLFFGLHLIHEVTSPQAFQMLRETGFTVRYPDRTFATIDHIVPTVSQLHPFGDTTTEEMTVALFGEGESWENVQELRPYGTT